MTAPPEFREVSGDDKFPGQTTVEHNGKRLWVRGTGEEARAALVRAMEGRDG